MVMLPSVPDAYTAPLPGAVEPDRDHRPAAGAPVEGDEADDADAEADDDEADAALGEADEALRPGRRSGGRCRAAWYLPNVSPKLTHQTHPGKPIALAELTALAEYTEVPDSMSATLTMPALSPDARTPCVPVGAGRPMESPLTLRQTQSTGASVWVRDLSDSMADVALRLCGLRDEEEEEEEEHSGPSVQPTPSVTRHSITLASCPPVATSSPSMLDDTAVPPWLSVPEAMCLHMGSAPVLVIRSRRSCFSTQPAVDTPCICRQSRSCETRACFRVSWAVTSMRKKLIAPPNEPVTANLEIGSKENPRMPSCCVLLSVLGSGTASLPALTMANCPSAPAARYESWLKMESAATSERPGLYKEHPKVGFVAVIAHESSVTSTAGRRCFQALVTVCA
jgi:hypothetical protein